MFKLDDGQEQGLSGRRLKIRGFALVLSLVVIAFFTMTILVIAQFAQATVDDRKPATAELLAKQQAKVAFAVALGQLQMVASQDMRAIAPMRMIDAEAPHGWLGVWDTDASHSESVFLERLISNKGVATGEEVLFYAGNSDIEKIASSDEPNETLWEDANILAPLVEQVDGDATRSFAYYVSDESMKILVGTGDHGFEKLISPIEKTPFVYQKSGYGAYFQILNPDIGEDLFYPLDPRLPEHLAFTDKVGDLDYLDYAPSASTTDLLYSEQDITTLSAGVLSRMNGETGLLEDLSLNPSVLGPGLAAWLDYESYMLQPNADLPISKTESDPRKIYEMQGYSDTAPSSGEIVHVLAPIITDFGIQFSPRHNENPTSIQMRMVLELWNPYAQALKLDEMEIRVRGIPDFEVVPVSVSTNPDMPVEEHLDHAFTVRPMDVFGEKIEGMLGDARPDDAIVFKLDFRPTPSKSEVPVDAAETKYWPPGRLLYWVGKNNALAAGRVDDGYGVFGSRNSQDSRYALPNTPEHNWPSVSHTGVRYEFPESQVSVELVLRRDGSVLQKLESLEFLNVSSSELPLDWTERYLTFQTRKLERANVMDHQDISIWVRNTDPRLVHPSFGFDPANDSYTTRAGQLNDPLVFPEELALKHYHANFESDEDDGPSEDQRFVFNRVISNNLSSDYLGPLFDPILFDLPNRPVLSVGELQHVYVEGSGPYAIGNAWGGTLNAVFDKYFFSGQKIEESSGDSPLHPMLRGLMEKPAGHVYQPEELMVMGRFNVNSLNPRAWATTLAAGSPDNFEYIIPDFNLMDSVDDAHSLTALALPPIFSRFPYSMNLWMGMDPNEFRDEATDPPIQFFQQGYSFLTEREANEYVLENAFDARDISLAEALGKEIVKQSLAKGRPLYRVSDLIQADTETGTSLLERAIQAVPRLRQQIFDGSDEALQAVDPLLPAYTLPSDIMSLIAPVVSVRGDTFLIRTHGGYRNSQVDTSIQMEALVQRMPRTLAGDPSKRDYQVLSTRWIE